VKLQHPEKNPKFERQSPRRKAEKLNLPNP
jgi:hypothetical protein